MSVPSLHTLAIRELVKRYPLDISVSSRIEAIDGSQLFFRYLNELNEKIPAFQLSGRNVAILSTLIHHPESSENENIFNGANVLAFISNVHEDLLLEASIVGLDVTDRGDGDSIAVAQKIRDKNLEKMFHRLREQFPDLELPPIQLSAKQIRYWMEHNPEILQVITALDLEGAGLSHVPPEINLLTNLEKLNLSLNRIRSLPEGFNPPHLMLLSLSHSSIEALPEGFNPQSLFWLYLSHTPIASLPSSLNLSNLHFLDLSYTRLTALPADFCPPQLESFNCSNTSIRAMPEGFRYPRFFHRSQTPFGLQETIRTALKVMTFAIGFCLGWSRIQSWS